MATFHDINSINQCTAEGFQNARHFLNLYLQRFKLFNAEFLYLTGELFPLIFFFYFEANVECFHYSPSLSVCLLFVDRKAIEFCK